MELVFNRRLRGAQKEITKEDKHESSIALASALRANAPVDKIDLSSRHTTVKAVRYEMVRSIQKVLGPVMIRRTLQSTRWDQSRINPNLPDKSVFNFLVRLTDHEHALLNGELGIVGESLQGQVFEFEVCAFGHPPTHIDPRSSVSGCTIGSAFAFPSRICPLRRART